MAWEGREDKELPKENVDAEELPVKAGRELQQDADNQQVGLLVASESPVVGEADAGKEDVLITFPRRKKLSLPTVSLSAALLLLLLASGWILYTKMIARPKHPLEVLFGPTSPWETQIKEYEKRMLESRDKFDMAWDAASDKAKMMFATYYMPSTERGRVAVNQALSYFKLQVLEMSQLGAPDSKEEQAVKQQYLMAFQIVTSLVDAAAERLNGLRELEQNGDLPALIFNRDNGRQTLREYERETPVPLGDFFEILKENKIDYRPLAAGADKGAARAKVKELIDLMKMEDTMLAVDEKVRLQFEPFLKLMRLSLKTMKRETLVKRTEAFSVPRDDEPYDIDMFLKFLLERHLSTEAKDYRTDLLDSLAKDFSDETVEKAIKAFRENHKNRLDDLVKQKRMTVEGSAMGATKLHESFPLSVFVL